MSVRDLLLHETTELADTFALLGDPTRLSIVIACMDVEKSAGDIAADLGLSASLTSHHLRLLRSASILKSERRGKKVFYTMADSCVHSVLMIMIKHVSDHTPKTADVA